MSLLLLWLLLVTWTKPEEISSALIRRDVQEGQLLRISWIQGSVIVFMQHRDAQCNAVVAHWRHKWKQNTNVSAFLYCIYFLISIRRNVNSSHRNTSLVRQHGRHLHIKSPTWGKHCPSALTVFDLYSVIFHSWQPRNKTTNEHISVANLPEWVCFTLLNVLKCWVWEVSWSVGR